MAVGARDGTFTTADAADIAFTHYPAPGPEAKRLVLVHSLALNRTVWNGVVERLCDEAEILTFDCRGHGESDRQSDRQSDRRPDRGGSRFTAESFAQDLAQLLDHVGWSRATIAGCSMGGCVALAFGGLYPARVDALGLIDTTAWYGADAAAKFRERAEAAREKGLGGLIDFQVTRWFSDGFRAANPELVAQVTAVFLANDFDCYAATCALLGDADLRAHLPSLRMPVAIVVGEEDYATPVAMAEQLHAGIPQSTLTVLAHARHLTPIEHPDRIASELRDLLRRV
jgi:3-oxoadipate enol-lactonase